MYTSLLRSPLCREGGQTSAWRKKRSPETEKAWSRSRGRLMSSHCWLNTSGPGGRLRSNVSMNVTSKLKWFRTACDPMRAHLRHQRRTMKRQQDVFSEDHWRVSSQHESAHFSPLLHNCMWVVLWHFLKGFVSVESPAVLQCHDFVSKVSFLAS